MADDELEKLAQEVLRMSRPDPSKYGASLLWERNVKGMLARIFRLGMGVGWDKHAAVVAANPERGLRLAIRASEQDEARLTQVGMTPPPLGSQGPELRIHNHEDNGTVEGCRGCFPAAGLGRELTAGDQRRRAVRATEDEH